MPFSSFRDFATVKPDSSDFIIGYNPLRGEFKTTILSLSGVIGSGGADLYNLVATFSGDWDSTYNTVNTLSSLWFASYLPTSGGNVHGDVVIDGNLTVTGAITALSGIISSTYTSTTSALSVIHIGIGPALFVEKGGIFSGSIATFQDETNISVLDVGRVVDGKGRVSINLAATDATEQLTIAGNMSASGSLSANDAYVHNNLTTQGQILSAGIDIANFIAPSRVISTVTNYLSSNIVALSAATVAGGVSASDMHAISLNDADTNRGLIAWQYGDITAGARIQGRKARGTASTPAAVQASDTLLGIWPYAYDGTSQGAAGYIAYNAASTWNASSHASILTFATVSAGSVTPAERMRIDNNGNVSINSTNAGGNKLYVTGNAALTAGTLSLLRPQLDYNVVNLQNEDGVQVHLNANNNSEGNLRTVTNHKLSFSTNNTERMVISNTGNVGIGTTTPQTKLAIVGALSGAGNLTYGDITALGGVSADGNMLVAGAGGIGYGVGSGGTIVQSAMSRTNGVTINKTNGAITLYTTTGSTAWTSFTVTNSTVAATDTVVVCQKSGTDLYEIHVTAVANGSFRISFRTTGGTTIEAPVFNFAVIKAVTS